MAWDEGYFSGIPYIQKCYRELNPTHLQYALLNAGYEQSLAQDFTYCELGFGQGISLCVHAAAAAGGRFFGTDFMPEHAYLAQQLASISGADIQIFDHSFADFFDMDLPDFDVITMHGVWSWVSEENRIRIVDFLRRKLKVGGMFYIGYNTLPAWSQIYPVRNLFVAHDRFMPTSGVDIASRVGNALDFAKKLADIDSGFFNANPAAKKRIDHIATQDLAYVAHEYFNDVSAPMHFHEVNDLLAPAKIAYACAADMGQQLDAVGLPPNISKILAGIDNDIFRETVRGYVVNEEFRRDIFVKGLPRLTPEERNRRLAQTSFVLVADVSAGVKRVSGPLGKLLLSEETYQPLLAALADDGDRPKSLGELAAYPELKDRPCAMLARNVAVLVFDGWLAPVQPPAAAAASTATCARLNREFLTNAEVAPGLNILASPLTGGGVAVSLLDQMFLSSHAAGQRSAKNLFEYAWKLFKVHGQGFRQDGKVTSGDAENRAILSQKAEVFLASRLARYQVLGIAEATRG